jgi:hypothetical protein
MPVIIGFRHFKFLSPGHRTLFFYCLLSLAVESVVLLLWTRRLNNLPIFHAFTCVEILLFANYFKQEINSKTFNRYLVVTLILFFCFFIINILFFQGLKQFNTYSISAESVLLITYASISLFVLLKRPQIGYPINTSLLLVCSAILIFNSGNLFLFIMGDYLSAHFRSLSKLSWVFHSVLNILSFVIFGIALWKQKKQA